MATAEMGEADRLAAEAFFEAKYSDLAIARTKIRELEVELADVKAAAERSSQTMRSSLECFGLVTEEQDPERLAAGIGQLGTAFFFVCEAIGLASMFGDRAGHPSFAEWDEMIRNHPLTLHDLATVEKVLWPRFVAAFCFLKDMRGEDRPGLTEEAARDVAMIESVIRHGLDRRAKGG